MSSFDKKLQDPESIPSRVLGDAGLNFVTAILDGSLEASIVSAASGQSLLRKYFNLDFDVRSFRYSGYYVLTLSEKCRDKNINHSPSHFSLLNISI